MKRNISLMLTVMVMIISLIGTGCLGQFAAFNKLSDWNQKVTDNKFVNEVIFLAFNIVPVYGIAYLGDVLIFNSIEFWTGENPMMAEGVYKKTVQSGNDKFIQTFRQTGDLKTMTVDYYSQNRLTNTLMLSQRIGSSKFHGITVASDGMVENFKINAEEKKLFVTRYSTESKPTTQVVQEQALQSLSDRVAGLIDVPMLKLASAR
jgi:hypothetical protein